MTKSIEPNASLLIILTKEIRNNCEKVLFVYLKELEDIYDGNKVYWYPKYGDKGDAKYLWDNEKLKEWVCAGRDYQIQRIWANLFDNKTIFENIQFKVPENIIEKNDFNENDQNISFRKIQEIQLCRNYRQYYSCKEWNTIIRNDLGILCDANDNKIMPLFPQFFFDKKLLKMIVCKKIFAIKEKRGISMYFRGVKDKNNTLAPERIKGFVQTISYRGNYFIEFYNKDKQSEGKIKIPLNGLWSLQLNSPLLGGSFFLQDINGNKLCGENFAFFSKLNITINVQDKEVIDFFGRKYSYNVKSLKKQIMENKSFLWRKDSDINNDILMQKLSDKLTEVLESLSPKILIRDPYFLGDIDPDNINIYSGTAVFFNALVVALTKVAIKEISILGSWRKIKRFLKEKSKEKFIQSYREIFNKFSWSTIERVNLYFSDKAFHDRYWLNFDSDYIYHISKSINGFTEDELNVSLIRECDIKIKNYASISRQLNKAKKEPLYDIVTRSQKF
jgi:hypothetical protein